MEMTGRDLKVLDLSNSEALSLVLKKVQTGQLPFLRLDEDRPYVKSDFVAHVRSSREALSFCREVLKCTIDRGGCQLLHRKDVQKVLVVNIILLCGENTSSEKPWTESEHVALSYNVLGLLKSALNCETVTEIFLSVNSDQILRWCLQQLHPMLEDKSFCRNWPGAQTSFVWILHHITFPNLSGFIGEFLPYSLRFLDDWEARNKLVGIQCLNHIVVNISPTELTWYGRSELITDVLYKALVGHQDELLVSHVCRCWFQLLRNTVLVQSKSVNAWDQLAKQFLYKMEMATKPELKICYSQQLPHLLEGLGSSTARWMVSILRIIANYSAVKEGNDEVIRIETIKALGKLMHLQPNRSEYHLGEILEILTRLLFELSHSQSGDYNGELFRHCSELFCFSANKFPERFLHLCNKMEDVELNEVFSAVIKEAFAKAKSVVATDL